MSSWGKAHASASNKPKFAPVDENAPDNRGDIYATNQGWVRAAGTKGSGNDNVMLNQKFWLQSVVLQVLQQQQD